MAKVSTRGIVKVPALLYNLRQGKVTISLPIKTVLKSGQPAWNTLLYTLG